MARIFLQLKLRIYRNSWRAGTGALVRFVLSLVFGLQFAAVGFVAIASLRLAPEGARFEIATCLLFVTWLGWVIGPLAATGYDNTLELQNFILLPLRRKQLISGMLASSFLGVGPLCGIIALSGAFVGLTSDFWSVLFAAPLLAGFIFFCVLSTRMVGVMLAGLLRSRRGRELAVALVSLAAASAYLALVFSTRITLSLIESAADLLAWTPPGWAAAALQASATGKYPLAFGQLTLLWLAIAACAVGWRWALDRAMTSADSSTPVRGSHSRRGQPASTGLRARIVAHPLGAATAWNLTYTRRAPHRRIGAFAGVVTGIGAPLALVSTTPDPGQGWMFLTILSGWTMAAQGANAFGFDGQSRWQFLVTGFDIGTDLRGRNLALAILSLPAVLAAATIVAGFVDGWATIPAATAVGLGSYGVGLGLSNVISAWSPYAAPDNARNPLAMGRPDSGGLLFLLTGASMVAQIILVVPLIAMAFASLAGPGLTVGAILLSLVWGGGCYWILTWVALKRVRGREPELLAAVATSG